MIKGKVIALSVLGFGNKIYSSGEKVTPDCFPEGNWDKLLEGKFIELDTTEEKVVEQVMVKLTAEDLKNNPDLVEAGLKEGEDYIITESFVKPENGKKGKKK